MELKKKQRLIGAFVLLGVVLLQLPFLFHSKRPVTKTDVSIAIPKPPSPPKIDVAAFTKSPEHAPKPVAKSVVTPLRKEKELAVVEPTKKKMVVQKVAKKTPNKPVAAKKVIAKKPPLEKKVSAKVSRVVAKKKVLPLKKKVMVSKVVADKKDKKVISSKKASVMPSAWSIQVGVFSERDNANAVLKKLRAKGYEAYLRSLKKNNKSLMVVFVGPEISLKKIQKMQKQIKQAMRLNGFIKKYQL